MQKLLATTAILVLIGGGALAQSGSGVDRSAPGAAAKSAPEPRPAPVGHRQPRAETVPAGEANDISVRDPQDLELDRKIRGICRGC